MPARPAGSQLKELAELGWTDGRNLQIDIRRAGANADRAHIYAEELIALHPDVLVAQATAPTAALQQRDEDYPDRICMPRSSRRIRLL
jgi:putative ABC transport system substrate-binding protein